MEDYISVKCDVIPQPHLENEKVCLDPLIYTGPCICVLRSFEVRCFV